MLYKWKRDNALGFLGLNIQWLIMSFFLLSLSFLPFTPRSLSLLQLPYFLVPRFLLSQGAVQTPQCLGQQWCHPSFYFLTHQIPPTAVYKISKQSRQIAIFFRSCFSYYICHCFCILLNINLFQYIYKTLMVTTMLEISALSSYS